MNVDISYGQLFGLLLAGQKHTLLRRRVFMIANTVAKERKR